ncbi:hypothetical protein KUTeg_020644 [Tegillarca granosa]|uniref:Uncharacterized protein n=1 Tax=Tegillarca granosa TaxID=220873 RepID=A0ABQ9E8K8_TEGGR|nr:hypothetical protein KUTeg_020644 [Tegillarca granosa]
MFGASVLMQFPSTIFFHLCNYSNNIKIQFVAMNFAVCNKIAENSDFGNFQHTKTCVVAIKQT